MAVSDLNHAFDSSCWMDCGLAWPVRTVRAALLGGGPNSNRRVWTLPLLLSILAFIVVLPFDGPLSAWFSHIGDSMGGDLRRELHAWQQFGAAGSIVFTILVITLLDRRKVARVGDLLIAVGLSIVVCTAMKLGVGRPRPRDVLNDPHTFLGPWGKYPLEHNGQTRLVHAWDISGGAGTDLWSMPSSHTFYAVVLAVFLTSAYPKGKPLWIGLVVLVGFCRLLFDAHWPTDVIVGAGVGAAIARWVMSVSRSARAHSAHAHSTLALE